MTVKQIVRIFFIAAAAFATAAGAQAQSCTATIDNLSFGTVNLTTGLPYDTNGTMQISCSGTAGSTVRVCPNIGAGSGGTSGGSPRLMTGAPAGSLAYNIFQDSGHNVVWGSVLGGTGGATPPQIDIVLDGTGSGSASRTVYASVSGGQQTLAPASFSSNFSGSDVRIASAYADTDPTCLTIGDTNATSASFSTSANYVSSCTIAANALSFGTIATSMVITDADTTITTQCSASTPYQVALDGGLTSASNPAFREMQKGADRLTYGIYRNSGRTQVWGHIPNVNTYAGTGTGLSTAIPVYGRIHAQERREAGTYTDMIIVTIDY